MFVPVLVKKRFFVFLSATCAIHFCVRNYHHLCLSRITAFEVHCFRQQFVDTNTLLDYWINFVCMIGHFVLMLLHAFMNVNTIF